MKRLYPSIVVLLGFLATVAYSSSFNSSLFKELNLVRPAEAGTANSPAPEREPVPKFKYYPNIITGEIVPSSPITCTVTQPITCTVTQPIPAPSHNN